jgi:hypothetical protein
VTTVLTLQLFAKEGQPFYLDFILKLKLKKANMGDHGLIVTALCKGFLPGFDSEAKAEESKHG